MDSIKRNDKVSLSQRSSSIYLLRTDEELAALKKADAEAGRWHDDAGEPILYGAYSGWSSLEELDMDTIEVTVTSLRPKWNHYTRRPKGLVGGWCEALNREVLFTQK